MNKTFLILILMIISVKVNAQNPPSHRSPHLSFSASYMELKDQINHGFVFRGPDVVIEYGIQRLTSLRYFNYSFSVGGGGKTTLGTWGFRWAIIPVDIVYSFNLYNTNENAIYLGPAFSANYSIQNYPDMHSGWLNWMTNYNLGVHFLGLIDFQGKKMKVQASNTVLSLTGRPNTERDQYYYSLRVGDIVANIHKNMHLSLVHEYLQTELSTELSISERSSFSYTFQYIGYYEKPKFQQLLHAMKYTYYFNKIGW